MHLGFGIKMVLLLGIILLGIAVPFLFILSRQTVTKTQDTRSRASFVTPLPSPQVRDAVLPTPKPSITQGPSVIEDAPQEVQTVVELATSSFFTLSGTVFVDSDGDGLFDMDESGYSGAEVKLVGGGTRTTTSSSTGAYRYTGLSAGSYTVLLTIPSGYMVTTNSMTNLYLSADRRHHIGIQLIPSPTASPTSSPETPGPTAAPTSTPEPTATPNQANYYVDPAGSDSADGSQATPYKTIQKAVTVTKTDGYPGAIIHVMPGTYREAVSISSVSGTGTSPVEIKAENGQNTVYVLGSESSQSSSITWAQNDGGLSFPSGVASHIYRADVTSWNATPELAVNNRTIITRLWKAHEPDFSITTPWKYHQNWWKADGRTGSTSNTLIDATDDVGGTYPEALTNSGNLSNLNGFTSDFLAGGRIFLKDTYDGHDSFSTTIASHDASTGTITFDTNLQYYDGNPAVGQYAKYYVEGKPQLLDTEGEWYYDSTTHYLYIWPPGDVNPNTIDLEFAVRNTAFTITKSAYVTLKDLNLQFTNYTYSGVTGQDGAVRFAGFSTDNTSNITLDGLQILHNGIGLRLYQSNASETSPGMLSYVTIKNSKILNTDNYGLVLWPSPRTVGYTSPINHIWLENNEFGYMAFRAAGGGAGDAIFSQYAEKFVLINNYFHDSAHNTVHFQLGKSTGNVGIYIANNVFDAGCYNGSDCGGLKLLEADSGSGVYNAFITHNIIRGTKGWTYASEVQSQDNSPSGYGYQGFGYYSDVVSNASGRDDCSILLYRNILQDNVADGIHYTRSRNQCAIGNVVTQSGTGIFMNNYSPTTDGSFENVIRGNIFQHTESGNSTNASIYGIEARLDQGNESELEINQNVYQITGTHANDMYRHDIDGSPSEVLPSVPSIQANTPWEDDGIDLSGKTVGIASEDHYDISSIESTFGIFGSSLPPESYDMVTALSLEWGINIPNGTNVGRNQ